MAEDFSNYPKSITEIRAETADEWTPRDALISILRRIDSGEISPITLVIAGRERTDSTFIWAASSPDIDTSLGLLTRVIYRLNEDADDY